MLPLASHVLIALFSIRSDAFKFVFLFSLCYHYRLFLNSSHACKETFFSMGHIHSFERILSANFRIYCNGQE